MPRRREATRFSARDLREKIEWEGGLAGMFDYTGDIDEYAVTDALKAQYKKVASEYDILQSMLDGEIGES